MTALFELNTQLKHDTHFLYDTDQFLILLHKNAKIPWFIIVPKTDVIETFDLPDEMQQSLISLIKTLSYYLKNKFNSEKINTAAIGNVVSQLHIHVIGRKTDDSCWPDVVWGNEYGLISYSKEEVSIIQSTLLNIGN